MRTFDRYILSQLLMLFGFFSLVLVAVYWVNRAVSLFDRLIAGGQNVSIFLEFTALALPNVIVNVLPLSALVATLYGINRLNQDSEWVVAQTSGIGPWALARPVLAFGAVVAVIVALLVHLLVPAARTALGTRGAEISRDVTARFLSAGEFLNPAPGITVYVREISEDGELRGIFLEDRRAPTSLTTYTAERALLVQTDRAPSLIMFEGMAQTLRKDAANLTVVTFEDFTYDLGALAKVEGGHRDLGELSTWRLLRASAQDRALTGARLADFRYEAHARFAEPLFAGLLPLLALGVMMLGAFSRLGLWRQILAAVLLAILMQMLGNLAETRVLRDASAWPLVYLPVALTLGVALLCVARSTFGPWRALFGEARA